ncbi:helix-turn-helix transcriptional regulator [Actinomadura harenae]|uniref:XRE family transcriptional regulator n=1 Tax=Actinomadura harenae TaxID=2483351 RepID=A0A3M2LI89_9ACTN|nr:helix-turn-helix transcriptional regulator [Actinomadura harenae]RMI37141.1 XRE family transcriptional regulator [Actinomadura harenae]
MTTTDFGRTMRTWRDRVQPGAAGLPAGGRRRASGLRREELAMLAGISADYVTRLEQGRAAHPSGQVVEALARALRLSGDERAHLFRLAGIVPPGPDTVPRFVTPGVHRLLDRMAGTPAAVYDAAWTILLANPPFAALMGDPSEWRGVERNVVWRHFLGPGGRARHTPESLLEFHTVMVSDLRTAAAAYPADLALRDLIAELRAGSERFARLWDAGVVRQHELRRKTIDHPRVGTIELDCDMLTVVGADLRVMLYTAEPGTEDAEKLELLTVLGTQSLTG